MIHLSAFIFTILYVFGGLLVAKALFFFFPKLEELFGGEKDL